MALPHSQAHRLALSLSYLISRYFAVFSFSSNIKYDTSCQLVTLIPPTCSAPLEAWQGSAHADDARLHLKPCSDFSTFVWSLTHLLPTQNLRWRLHEPCMELSHASDTLASTCLCSASLHSLRSPYGLLPCWPSVPLSAPLWTNDRLGGTGHDTSHRPSDMVMYLNINIYMCASGGGRGDQKWTPITLLNFG